MRKVMPRDLELGQQIVTNADEVLTTGRKPKLSKVLQLQHFASEPVGAGSGRHGFSGADCSSRLHLVGEQRRCMDFDHRGRKRER